MSFGFIFQILVKTPIYPGFPKKPAVAPKSKKMNFGKTEPGVLRVILEVVALYLIRDFQKNWVLGNSYTNGVLAGALQFHVSRSCFFKWWPPVFHVSVFCQLTKSWLQSFNAKSLVALASFTNSNQFNSFFHSNLFLLFKSTLAWKYTLWIKHANYNNLIH